LKTENEAGGSFSSQPNQYLDAISDEEEKTLPILRGEVEDSFPARNTKIFEVTKAQKNGLDQPKPIFKVHRQVHSFNDIKALSSSYNQALQTSQEE